MRAINLFIIVVIIISPSLFGMAQSGTANSSGLYATAADFTQHSLMYPFTSSNQKNKIHLNDLFESHTGYILQNGQKHFFNKNETYGYRNNNKDYRFYNNASYQIIDTSGFYIYYHYEQKELTRGKEPVKTDEYYFSTGTADKLFLLTIDNLQKAFPKNNRFHYSIEENFKSDKDLLAYDHFVNAYKIKYLFTQSFK